MARRSRARFLSDGVLVVNKAPGLTSHEVVQRLRRRYRPAKLGHCGTLDPFATGVLVLAWNQATKMAQILGSGEKVYQGKVALGVSTDTGDLTGQVKETAAVPDLQVPQVEAALQGLVGERLQAPPAYSAAKHHGKPLYSYARKGVVVVKPPRPIKVYEARLNRLEEGEIDFTLRCSRGTYVRSLSEDLAESLGARGHLGSLRRLVSDPFSQGEAWDLEELLDLGSRGLAGVLLDVSAALERCGLPAVEVDADTAWELRQGRILPLNRLRGGSINLKPGSDGAFRVLETGAGLVAVLRLLSGGGSRPRREYETVRVFPGEEKNPAGYVSSASALGAE